jgi:hypothetical protein
MHSKYFYINNVTIKKTTIGWRNAKAKLKKCTHPGKDNVTKPALFHCPLHLYMDDDDDDECDL